MSGTVVISESTTPLHNLGVVSTLLQVDLGGRLQLEVYLGDRLVEAIDADFRSGQIAYDEYVDFDGLSTLQAIRIVGAFVHATAHAFDDITFGGTPSQALDWCKIGCSAAGGALGAAAGAGAGAACGALFKNPGPCAGVAGAVFTAVGAAVGEACEQTLCED